MSFLLTHDNVFNRKGFIENVDDFDEQICIIGWVICQHFMISNESDISTTVSNFALHLHFLLLIWCAYHALHKWSKSFDYKRYRTKSYLYMSLRAYAWYFSFFSHKQCSIEYNEEYSDRWNNDLPCIELFFLFADK